MWKKVRNITLIIASIFSLLLVGLVVFTMVYEDEIEQRIVSELNETLLTEIETNGEIELTLISNFPYTTLEINDIVIHGSLPETNDTLLIAGRISMVMNTWDIITQNWNVQRVVIEDGDLFLHRTVDGAVNYKLTEPTGKKSDASIFVSIEEAELENIHFRYLDDRGGLDIDVDVNDIELGGDFAKNTLYIEAVADVHSNKVIVKDRDYANNKAVSFDAVVEINTDSNSYDISSERLAVEGNIFTFDGVLGLQKKRDLLDIEVQGVEIDFGNFLSILPDRYASELDAFDASGDLSFEASIKGALSKEESPHVILDFDLSNGLVNHEYDDEPIENFRFKGTFSNGDENRLKSSVLTLDELKGTIGGGELTADLTITNFIDPTVDLTCNGVLNLSIINPLLENTDWKLGGKVELDQLHFEGSVDEMRQFTSKAQTIKGAVVFNRARVYHNGESLTVKDGRATLSPWTIQLSDVLLTSSDSDLSVNGKFTDWKGYLSVLINGKTKWVKPMTVDAVARSTYLVPDDFKWLFASSKSSESTGTTATAPTLRNYTNVRGTLTVNAATIYDEPLTLNDLQTELKLTPGRIDFEQASLDAFTGRVTAYGGLQFTDNNIAASGNISADRVNVSEVFRQMDNFGMEHLTDQNIKGTLTSNMDASANWSNGQFDPESLKVTADVSITDGELVDFKTLESLSKFIHLEELRHVEFKTLENQIFIADGKVAIPRMIIRSTAMNLSVEGSYTFTDYVDFRIKLNMLEILGNKFRRKNREVADYEIIDDNSFNFYIAMKGPIDDLSISYDKMGLKERFKQQKEELRSAVHGSNAKYTREKEYRDWETENDTEFLDWNDTIPY